MGWISGEYGVDFWWIWGGFLVEMETWKRGGENHVDSICKIHLFSTEIQRGTLTWFPHGFHVFCLLGSAINILRP